MIIVGNKNIPYQNIVSVNSIDDIKNTNANEIVYFAYDIELIKYCSSNSVKCAVNVSNITEAIFCNALDVFFIISHDAKSIQDIADNYMFDSKVLQVISNDNDIQNTAKNEIDGCVYKEILC